MFKRTEHGGGFDQCLRLFAFVHQFADRVSVEQAAARAASA